jgi:hypothetical protein
VESVIVYRIKHSDISVVEKYKYIIKLLHQTKWIDRIVIIIIRPDNHQTWQLKFQAGKVYFCGNKSGLVNELK